MSEISFFVPGVPLAQGRPRAFLIKKTQRVRVYDPENSREWKAQVRWLARQEYPGGVLTGPIRLVLMFALPRPKSLPKKITEHTKRPDCSNLAKAVEDALRGVLYHDDSQITWLTIIKSYVHEDGEKSPGVRITVHPQEGL